MQLQRIPLRLSRIAAARALSTTTAASICQRAAVGASVRAFGSARHPVEATRRSGPPAGNRTTFLSSKTFADLHLPAQLAGSLRAIGLTRASEIQALALPTVLKGSSAVVAAETGSGKTMLYVLPVAAAAASAAKNGDKGGDFAVILLPNQELVLQVSAVVRMVTAAFPCEVIPLSSGMMPTPQTPQKVRPGLTAPSAAGSGGSAASVDGPASAAAAPFRVYVGTPAAYLNHLEAMRKRGGSPDSSQKWAPRATAASTPAASLDRAASGVPRAGSAAAVAAAAAAAAPPAPATTAPVLVAFDEADLLLSPTHRSVVERCLVLCGAATLDAPRDAGPPAIAVALPEARRPGAPKPPPRGHGKQSAAVAAAPPADGGSLRLHEGVQFIACAATLLEPMASAGKSAGSRQQHTFGSWLHRHLKHAAVFRSPGLHRPTSLVRIRLAYVEDRDLDVAGAAAAELGKSGSAARRVQKRERAQEGGGRDARSRGRSDGSAQAVDMGAAGDDEAGGGDSSRRRGRDAAAASLHASEDDAYSDDEDGEAADALDVLQARRLRSLVRALQSTLPPPPGASDDAEEEAAEAAAASAMEDAADGVVSFSLRSPRPRTPAPSPSRAKQAGAALPGAYGTLGAGGTGSGSDPAPDRSGQALVFVNDFATAEQVAGALEDLGAFCCSSGSRLPLDCSLDAGGRRWHSVMQFCCSLSRITPPRVAPSSLNSPPVQRRT